MIALCNPVAIQPEIYLKLQNSTADISHNAYTTTPQNLSGAIGIFGESNGATYWNSVSDKLTFASSVGNSVANYINNEATITCFYNTIAYVGVNDNLVFFQYLGGGDSDSSFYLGTKTPTTATVSKRSGGGVDSQNLSGVYASAGIWAMVSHVFDGFDCELFKDGVSIGTVTNDRDAYESSTADLQIGGFGASNYINAKMNNFKVYNVKLSEGQLAVLYAQLGRVN